MPCRSDYMDPTHYEESIAETSRLLCFVLKKLKLKPSADEIKFSNACNYPDKVFGDKVTARLCKILSAFNKKQTTEIIYNAKDKDSRKLADWWEEHQIADKKREAKEKAEKAAKKLKDKALSKLTKAERAALDI